MSFQLRFRLPIPEEVRKATLAYRGEMDLVGGFIDECCLESPGATVGSGELYNAYLDWCRLSREKAISQKSFTQRLDERGHQRRKSTKGLRKWYGIGLIDKARGEEEPLDNPDYAEEHHNPGDDEGLAF